MKAWNGRAKQVASNYIYIYVCWHIVGLLYVLDTGHQLRLRILIVPAKIPIHAPARCCMSMIRRDIQTISAHLGLNAMQVLGAEQKGAFQGGLRHLKETEVRSLKEATGRELCRLQDVEQASSRGLSVHVSNRFYSADPSNSHCFLCEH